MLPPVILLNLILDQARAWLDECLRRWDDPAEVVRIGEAPLLSPVDHKPRSVGLLLGQGFTDKGKTLPWRVAEAGQPVGGRTKHTASC